MCASGRHHSHRNPIAGGSDHSAALLSDGTLWAWGWNAYGQLGTGDTVDRLTPTQIGADDNWVSVAGNCSAHSTTALKSDGTLWAWGWNAYGQLGTGDTADRHSPTEIGTGNYWVSVAAGLHTMALKADGTLWAWGYNGYGQLGTGDTADRHSPIQVGADNKWTSVAVGDQYTVALKTDGTLWAWGFNYYGQLGTGDTVDRHGPAQIGTGNYWVSVAADKTDTVALKSDGTLWAWGYMAGHDPPLR